MDLSTGSEFARVYVTVVLRDSPDLSALCVVGAIQFEESTVPELAGADHFDLKKTGTHIYIKQLLNSDHPPANIIQVAMSLITHEDFMVVEDKVVLIDITDSSLEVMEEFYDTDLILEPVILTNDRKVGYADGATQIPRRDCIAALLQSYRSQALHLAEIELARQFEASIKSLNVRKEDKYEALSIAAAIGCWKIRRELPPTTDHLKDVASEAYDPLSHEGTYDVLNFDWGDKK